MMAILRGAVPYCAFYRHHLGVFLLNEKKPRLMGPFVYEKFYTLNVGVNS